MKRGKKNRNVNSIVLFVDRSEYWCQYWKSAQMSKNAQKYECILNNLKVKQIEIDSGLIQAIGNKIIG